MKAILDHVGIAVQDLDAALAFYRDSLGLTIEDPEEVATQRVRAHIIPVGDPALELLEGTTADSPITKFVEKRGPGIHHITLRVDDINAALTHLRSRGVRLIDPQPRPGAHGSMVAFIHPASAHGVLVELKQAAAAMTRLTTHCMPWGDLEIITLHDGLFRLDGGAMYGVVPKPLWARETPPDDRNRIQLAMRPRVIRAEWGTLMIDCGIGDKMDEKQTDIFAIDHTRKLDDALTEQGLTTESIEGVLATHLHFDHFGGATMRRRGDVVPRFTRARYFIRDAEWHDATHAHERNRASYLPDDFLPLKQAGVVDFYTRDQAIRPGVRVVRTGGHTGQHQIVYVESGGKTAVFVADLIPVTSHIRDPWIMGYDLFPMETLAFKKQFIREAIDREYLILFEHDPLVIAGYIREKDGRRYVEPAV
jgi:methylmalonyl-CoA epimerase